MRLPSLALHTGLALLFVFASGMTGLASPLAEVQRRNPIDPGPMGQTDTHYPIPAVVTGAPPQGRVSGVVNDENNKAIRAATVTVENVEVNETHTATTDEKGRFTLIGLRSGTWRFEVWAPGYFGDQGLMPVRYSSNPALVFALKKSGPVNGGVLAGIISKDLQSDLAAADGLFNKGQWDEAVAVYKAIVAKAPTLSVIDLQIAAAYVNKKDYDAAIASSSELLKIDPSNEKATVGMAKANVAKGDPAAAESALTKAAESPSAGRDVFYNLGEIVFDRGDTDGAMTWYQKAAAADPRWGKPWYKLGVAAEKKGDTASAAQFLNKVLVVDPASPEAAMAKSALDRLNR